MNGNPQNSIEMKKHYFIIACAVAAIATGCAKEVVDASSISSTTTIAVSIDESSRTVLGELSEGKRPIYWADGDVLCCNGVASAPLSDVPEKATSAEFTFDQTLDTPYNLLYPASLYKDAATITLPAVSGNIPLGGQGGSISALTGAVKLTIKGGEHQDKLSYVKLSSATAQLSGDFTIDYATGALTSTSSADADKSVKTVIGKTLAKDETVELFIPVPAGQYSFTVRIVDAMGHFMEKTTAAAKTIVAGQINAFPELVFAPTGTQFDVEIDSAQKWNAFAAAYNEGTVGDCFVAITDDLDFDGIDVTTIGNYNQGKYFGGVINGCNKTIKNLKSSNALVGAIGSSGAIKDLTIDESCSYTVDYELGIQKHFGPFTEYVKGYMTNCHNKAAITLSSNGNANDKDIYIGGVVGRIREGLLEECTNTGAILLDGTYSSANTYKLYAGGIVGSMSNADGKVKDCTNYGSISTAALCNTTVMGGIAGLSNGTVTSCTNETTGIVSSAMARPKGDACKFIMYGGIVGIMNGGSIVTSNVNKAEITTSSAVKQHYMGGVVAQAKGAVTLSDNTSSGNVSSTGGARNLFMGGLYGSFDEPNTLKITDSPFTGSISISGHESGSSVYIFAGGLVGLAKKDLTIVGTSCSLTSDISIPASSSTAAELFMGGVVGAAGETGAGKVSEGATKITISGITVSGNVKMTGGSSLTPKYKKAAFGGIIGGAFAGAEISSCTSSSEVEFCSKSTSYADDNNSNGNPAHLGGIAGRIEGGNSIISNCTATGKVYNYLYNNNWWNANNQIGINAVGGILGSFGYNKDQTYTIAISDCSSSGTKYGYRGTAGGIAGYLHNATISGNISFTGSISRGAPAAGIVAIANNCAISGCTVSTSAISANGAGSCIGHAGGIVGLGMSTSVDNCKSFASAITPKGGTDPVAGGIIGCPDASCTIGATNACSYGGKVGDTTISADNVAQYAIGNTEMTPANVTYWDGK